MNDMHFLLPFSAGVAVGAVGISLYFSQRGGISDKKQKIRALFFPDACLACPDKFSIFSSCVKMDCRMSHEVTSFAQVVRFLSSPLKSLDIAIFIFCSPILGQLVEQLFTKRKVSVRIIVDKDNADLDDSQIPRLRKLGIPVRVNVGSTSLMHHKFAVVDKSSLMTGSFNWTQTAITGNNENLVIIEDPNAAAAFHEQFEKLWCQLA